jgi:hypothetical protein
MVYLVTIPFGIGEKRSALTMAIRLAGKMVRNCTECGTLFDHSILGA